jgi:hypothetical protein
MLAVEPNHHRLVDLDDGIVVGCDGSGVHDARVSDLVHATRLVDMAAEHEIRLFLLHEGPYYRAAHMLAVSKAVARGSPRRRMRAEDLHPGLLY